MTNKLISKKVHIDEYVKRILEVTNKHLEKNKNRKMSLEEFDVFCEVNY